MSANPITKENSLSEVLELAPAPPPPQHQQLAAAAPASPAVLLQMAIAQGADLERLERLMALQERWEAGNAKKAYDDAHAAFKGEAVAIIKRKLVDFANNKGGRTTYMHAELSDVVDALAPALSKHGFSWKWTPVQTKDWIDVTCTLTHKAGHSESVTLGAAPDQSGGKNSIQAIISTKTYLERHTLKAITGVAEKGEDDDGKGAEPAPDPLEVWSGRAALAQTIDELTRVSKDGSEHFRGGNDVEAYKMFAAAVQSRGAALRAQAAKPTPAADAPATAGDQQ